MITREDLKNASDSLAADERRRLGEPPTADEMFAYSLGQLSPQESRRIQELLVCFPELAATLTAEFPEDDVDAADPAYVPPAEVDRRWAAMQQRLHGGASHAAAVSATEKPARDARVLQFWRAALAVAAMLVLVFAGLFFQARTEMRSLTAQLSAPRMAGEAQLLYPEGRRGSADSIPTLTRDGDSYLLIASLVDAPQFAEYRVDIVDIAANPPQTRWSSRTVLRRDLDSFAVVVPHTFLQPGRYEMVLYGVSGSRSERLSAFPMRVAAE